MSAIENLGLAEAGFDFTAIDFGRINATTVLAATRTFELQIEVDMPQDAAMALEIISAAVGTTTAIALSVVALASWDADDTFTGATAATWDAATLLNTSSSSVLRGATGRVGINRTDVMLPTPVARSDGNPRALYRIRGFCTSGTVIFAGNSGDNFDNWATRTDGPRMRVRYNTADGDQRASSSDWAASQTTPFVGLTVKSAIPVRSTLSVGDSQHDGRGTHLGAGPGLRACEMLTAEFAGAAVFSHANRASSGATYAQISNMLFDYFASGLRPEVTLLPIGSQNSVTAGFSNADARAMELLLVKNIALCRAVGSIPVLLAMPPAAPNSQFAWGSSGNAVWLAYNARWEELAAEAGLPFVPIPPSLISATLDNGQNTPETGQADITHYGDAQLDVWAAAIADVVRPLALFGRGNVALPFAQSNSPAAMGTATIGVSQLVARSDHVHPSTPATDLATDLGSASLRWRDLFGRNARLFPAASVTPATNGELTFEATSNTSVTVKLKGSDGTVRTNVLTMS